MKNIFYIHRPVCWQATEQSALPDTSFIPPMVRRRLSNIEKIALSLAYQSAPKTTDYRSVFASQYGEWQKTIDLIKQFFEERALSPAGFSISVHNAAAGFFSLLTKNENSYTSIAANEETLQAGFLEALTNKQPVLFVYAEEKTPDFYRPVFFNPFDGHGLACFLSDEPSDFKISVQFTPADVQTLTFEQCVRFLTGQTNELITPYWTMKHLL